MEKYICKKVVILFCHSDTSKTHLIRCLFSAEKATRPNAITHHVSIIRAKKKIIRSLKREGLLVFIKTVLIYLHSSLGYRNFLRIKCLAYIKFARFVLSSRFNTFMYGILDLSAHVAWPCMWLTPNGAQVQESAIKLNT